MAKLNDLLDRREQLLSSLRHLQAEMAEIEEGITKAATPQARQLFTNADKTHGDLTFKHGDTKLKATIRKTVKWDSEALKKIAAEFPAEDAAELFTVTLSISEDNFEILSEMDHPALGSVQLARTVKYSDLTVKVID